MKLVFAWLLPWAATVASALANPIPPIDVPGMVAGSDLVVAGWGKTKAGTHSGADVQVGRTLKGALSGPRQAIHIGGMVDVAPPAHALFFLHARGDEFGTVSNVAYYQYLRVPATEHLYIDLNGDTMHDVGAYLASTFAMPVDFMVDPRNGLNAEIYIVVTDPRRDAQGHEASHAAAATPTRQAEATYGWAYSALVSMPTDVVIPIARRIVDDSRVAPEGRLYALDVLLRQGDWSRLPAMMPWLLMPVRDGITVYETFFSAATFHKPPPELYQMFLLMLTSRNADVRTAGALRASTMSSDAAMKAMLAALHDPSSRVRWYAASGLCGMTRGCELPDIDHYADVRHAPELAAIVERWRAENR
jgi:hypothetical protein